MSSEMKRVADIFGVELYEEFLVPDYGGKERFWLTESGLYFYDNSICEIVSKPELLLDILTGECKLIKLIKRPKLGEHYFYISTNDSNKLVLVTEDKWTGRQLDYMNYKLGNVFPTKELAESNVERFVKLLNDTDSLAIEWREEYQDE